VEQVEYSQNSRSIQQLTQVFQPPDSNPHGDLGHQSSYVNDGVVAIGMALVLFVVPSTWSKSGRVLDWEVASRLSWHIVLLFGGGFALAQGFVDSGLSAWLGS
jgi:di/tricarboxylate transporter